jgi:hypothetical protein
MKSDIFLESLVLLDRLSSEVVHLERLSLAIKCDAELQLQSFFKTIRPPVELDEFKQAMAWYHYF